MTLYKNRITSKILIVVILIMLVVYTFYIRINFDMISSYENINSISMYDLFYYILSDPLIELIINLPFLLVFQILINVNENYYVMSRFSSRKKFSYFKIINTVYINIVLELVFICSLLFFSYYFTKNSTFNWMDKNSVIAILYNNSKSLKGGILTSRYIVILVSTIILFIRNTTISILSLLFSIIFNRTYAYVLAMIPFMLSAYYGGILIHYYIFRLTDSGILITTKIIFILTLLVLLINLYILLDERIR